MSSSNPAEAEAALLAEKAAFDAFRAGAEQAATDPLAGLAYVLDTALASAKELNEVADYRSRELSLAITNLEQAQMWVQKAAS